jgi:cytochrome bd-type quinol oxidase subunit 1
MVRVDLNVISVIGLILGAVAAVLVVIQYNTEADMRLGSLLGEGVPLAEIPLPWVVLFAALITYAVGRIVWIVKHHGGMPQLPGRPDEDE